MTKQQENRAFVKMLKEFPKAFGRISFRERLMLRTAFTYVVEEVIADIKANCDHAIEGRDVKIMELEQKLEQTEKDLADYQFNYPTIKELEEENEQLRNNGFTVSAMTEQQLKVAIEKGEQLEKQLEAARDLIHQFLIQNPISDWLPKKAGNFLKETEK